MLNRLTLLLLLLALPAVAWPSSGADLALQLLRRQDALENAALSPVSLQSAFAMLAAGAGGQTREELVQGLALGSNFLEASRDLRTSLVDDGAEVLLANRLWPDRSFTLSESYLSLCRETFGAAPEALDYQQPELARKTINAWVGESTRQKVPELLQPGDVTSSTLIVLTNALYFKGSWSAAFDAKMTSKATFHGPRGPLSTPMMYQEGGFPYYEDSVMQVISLGYKGSRMRMTLLVPRKVDGWKDLRASLDPELLKSLHAGLPETSTIKLHLPRFAAKSRLDVIPALMALGVKKPFSDGDFSAMGPGAMAVSKAIQEAVVEVNEEGTVAAAATAVAVSRSIPRAKVVMVDRPFLFTISDSRTGAILFLGQVVEPEKA